jgi:hypothetical protein
VIGAARTGAPIALLGASLAILCGCGATAPPRARTMPDDVALRDEAIGRLGSTLWEGLAAGDATALLLGEDALSGWMDGAASTRVRMRRPALSARLGAVHSIPEQLEGASYLGVCAQDARDEAAGGALGLLEPSWVIGRVLVAGRIAGGSRRIAMWVDGPFVFDGERFVAIDIGGVEAPRWEHSDLELGACDVSEGL